LLKTLLHGAQIAEDVGVWKYQEYCDNSDNSAAFGRVCGRRAVEPKIDSSQFFVAGPPVGAESSESQISGSIHQFQFSPACWPIQRRELIWHCSEDSCAQS
jgi:hypothetical protein